MVEIQCLKCKKKVVPLHPVLSESERAAGKCRIGGECPECGKRVSSFRALDWYNKLSAEDRKEFEDAKPADDK